MKVAVGAELVTIEADRVALGSLLKALDTEAGTTSAVPEQFASRMVSVWVNAAPLDQAIRKIFEGTLLDYAVVEGRRIVVLGDSSGATGTAATTTRPVQAAPGQALPGVGTFQLPGGARNPQAGEEAPAADPAAPAGRGGGRGGRGGRGGGAGRGGRGAGQPQAQQQPAPGLLNLPTASPSPAGQAGLGPAVTPFGIPLSPTDPGPPASGAGNAAPGAPQPFESIFGNASPTILDLARPGGEETSPGLPARALPGMPTQPLPPAQPVEPSPLPPPSPGTEPLPANP